MSESKSTLCWLAESLGWASLEERGSEVIANDSARPLLGDVSGDVWTHAAVLLQAPEATLREWAEAADRFVRTLPGGRQVIAERDECGWIVCADLDRDSLLRRAGSVDLAASVSHEVASTLGAIAGWAQILRSGETDTDPIDALRLIEDAARATRQTARDLLGQTRHPPPPTPEGVDISEVSEDVARLLKPQLHERGVALRVDTPGPLHVALARAAAFRVVWNLALNATQHARGAVLLRLRQTGEDETRLEVHDDGPGLANPSQVFEPYFTTRDEGTGLGLALVRRTAEEAGGSAGVTAGQLGGAGFFVVLPLADPAERRPSQTSGVVTRGQLPERVLIVEDDRGLRELLVTALELRGVATTAVSAATDAIAQGGPFDVALVDLTLDDGRGEDVMAALRQSGAARVVVGMSGSNPSEPKLADEWLRKPFEPDELIAIMERIAQTA